MYYSGSLLPMTVYYYIRRAMRGTGDRFVDWPPASHPADRRAAESRPQMALVSP